MKKAWNAALKAGFTLIEVLVTVVIIGVLAAVIIPAITNQIGAADPARVAEDLANVRTGIETFSLNVRPRFPGDLDDLANPITVADEDIKGAVYSAPGNINAWKGPYISATVPVTTVATTETASNSGYNSTILSDLASCSSTAGAGCVTPVAGDPTFVTVQMTGLDAAQLRAINDVIDGAADSLTASTTGKFRFTGVGPNAFFLATPYR